MQEYLGLNSYDEGSSYLLWITIDVVEMLAIMRTEIIASFGIIADANSTKTEAAITTNWCFVDFQSLSKIHTDAMAFATCFDVVNMIITAIIIVITEDSVKTLCLE